MVRLSLFFILLIFYSSNLFAKAKVYRIAPETVNIEGVEFSFDASRFSTNGWYDSEGNKTGMSSDLSYTSTSGEIIGRYGFSHSLEFRGGVRGRRNNSYTEGVHDLYRTGLESFLLGGKYYLPQENHWDLGFDVQLRRSFYTNPDSQSGTVPADEITLGDDGMDLFANVLLGHRSTIFNLSMNLGYRRPANDLSDEIIFGAEAAWAYFNRAALVLGVKGSLSLGTDQYSESPSLKPTENTGNTRLFNSINQSYTAPYAGINFLIGEVRLSGRVAYYAAGVSTDSGIETSLKLEISSGGKTIEKIIDNKFKEYDIEASVVKVSPRGVFLKIDKGQTSAIEKGMKIDIYKADYFDKNILVAHGYIHEVKPEFAIVKVVKTYRENISIEIGFLARGYEE